MSRNFFQLTSRLFAFATLAAALLALASSAQAGPITTNLAVWLEANQGVTTSGSNVTAWANQVTNSNNRGVTQVTQANGADQPVLTPGGLNGLPVVTFNGTTNFMQSTAFSTAISQGAEIFLVWSATITTPTGVSMPYDGLTDANRMTMDFEGNITFTGNKAIVMYAGGAGGNTGYASSFPSPIVSDAVFNGASSTLRENGALQTLSPTPTNTSPAVPGSDSLDGLTLGARHSVDSLWLNGYIAEMLVYTSPLSSGDQASVENYLDNKYFNTPLFTPEPSSFVLLGCACTAVLVCGRKRLAAIAAARLRG